MLLEGIAIAVGSYLTGKVADKAFDGVWDTAWDKAKDALTFPFTNALQTVVKANPSAKDIQKDIQNWFDQGELWSALAGSKITTDFGASVQLCTESFDKFCGHQFDPKTITPLFENLLSEFEIECRGKNAKYAVRAVVENEILFDDRIRKLESAFLSDRNLLQDPRTVEALMDAIKAGFAEQHHETLDRAKELLNKNEVVAAFELLESLKAKISDSADKKVRFRLLSNLGSCFLKFDELEKSEFYYNQAHEVDRENADGLANLALIEFRKRDDATALTMSDAALTADATSRSAIAISLLCMAEMKEYKRAKDLIASHSALIQSSSACMTSVAYFFTFGEEDLQQAIEWATRACNADEKSITAKQVLLRTKFRRKWLELQEAAPEHIPSLLEAQKEEIAKLVKDANELVDFCKTSTDIVATAHSLEIRCAVFLLSGEFDKGLQDCDEMDGLAPKSVKSDFLRARHFLQKADFKAIPDLLASRKDLGRDEQLLVAYAYYRLREYELAIIWYKKFIDETKVCQELKSYVHCLWFAGHRDKLKSIAAALRYSGSLDQTILIAELSVLFRDQNWAEAELVVDALIKCEPNNPDHYLNKIAMNMNLDRRAKALEAYSSFPSNLLAKGDVWGRSALSDLKVGMQRKGWI
jgi:tetratricopeptide (TPR) repeat protein